MFCSSCGATAPQGQRFCAGCGASLTLVSVPPGGAPTPTSLAPPPFAPPANVATTEPIAVVAQTPVAGQPAATWSGPATEQVPSWEQPRADVAGPPALLAAVGALAAVAGVVAAVTKLFTIEIGSVGGSSLKISDSGNGSLLVFSAVVVALLGVGLAWGKQHFGSGLVGGAGLVLAGLAMPLIGLVVEAFDSALQVVPGEETIRIVQTREAGFFALIAMMALGLIAFVVSLAAARSDGSAKVHPGLVVVGIAAAVVAGVAAMIPADGASFADNFANDFIPPATLWFRIGALVLLVVAGVAGFAQGRRWGMGLVLGGSITWLIAALTTMSEIGDKLTVGVFGPPTAGFVSELSPICVAALAVLVVAACAGLVMTSAQPRE
jgi:hypothetical protein